MRIAILVPIYRTEFSSDDQMCLRHLNCHLGLFNKFAIQPTGLNLQLPGFELYEFPAHHFQNVSTYSQLLLSSGFYERFVDYDYILICQLDCLVFSGELQAWAAMGYDYIGAPLFEKNGKGPHFSRVGNGGLSLRRVQAFLDVLNSAHVPRWSAVLNAPLSDLSNLPAPMRWLKRMRVIREAQRGIAWYTHHYSLNEDLFWTDRARLFEPSFKIAPLDVALRFAFDNYPRLCFERNNRQLPFGAHAWARWDREFWEPYLL